MENEAWISCGIVIRGTYDKIKDIENYIDKSKILKVYSLKSFDEDIWVVKNKDKPKSYPPEE